MADIKTSRCGYIMQILPSGWRNVFQETGLVLSRLSSSDLLRVSYMSPDRVRSARID